MASDTKVPPDLAERLLTPAEVAAVFRVDPKTVTRRAKAGKLSSVRTLGGHRRYREAEIPGLLSRRGQRPVRRVIPVNGDRPVMVIVHGKPWAGWPSGEPQSVRDAYDELLAEKGELWTAEDPGP